MDLTTISVIVAGLFGSATIWQFLSFRKQLRKIEATTKISEEEAQSAGFSNYKEKLNHFLEINNILVEDNFTIREENFDLKQRIKEYEYRFGTYDRKLQGMQRTIEDNIRKYNIIAEELTRFKERACYAEGNICLDINCKNRMPKIGTFKAGGGNK